MTSKGFLPVSLFKQPQTNTDGKIDLGHLLAEHVGDHVQAGPIRLFAGFQGSRGGFGCRHIESYPDRLVHLRKIGFGSVVDYVSYIAERPDLIALQPDRRLAIVRRGYGLCHHLICQWDGDVRVWSITTAIPKRHDRLAGVIWTRDK